MINCANGDLITDGEPLAYVQRKKLTANKKTTANSLKNQDYACNFFLYSWFAELILDFQLGVVKRKKRAIMENNF